MLLFGNENQSHWTGTKITKGSYFLLWISYCSGDGLWQQCELSDWLKSYALASFLSASIERRRRGRPARSLGVGDLEKSGKVGERLGGWEIHYQCGLKHRKESHKAPDKVTRVHVTLHNIIYIFFSVSQSLPVPSVTAEGLAECLCFCEYAVLLGYVNYILNTMALYCCPCFLAVLDLFVGQCETI